jgi:hypothetical protein
MAFTGYYGWVGAGKTLSAVADIYARFKRDPNIVVLSNTPLVFPKVKGKELTQYLWHTTEEIQEFFLFAFSEENLLHERPTIVFIDEANLVLPSRLFAKLPPFFLSFFAQARKMNVHIYFTTQHFTRVELVLRELVEVWVKCERIMPFGWIRMTEQEISPSGTIMEEHGNRIRFFKKKYFKMYDTLYKVGMDKHLMPPTSGELARLESFIDGAYRQPTKSAKPPTMATGAERAEHEPPAEVAGTSTSVFSYKRPQGQ